MGFTFSFAVLDVVQPLQAMLDGAPWAFGGCCSSFQLSKFGIPSWPMGVLLFIIGLICSSVHRVTGAMAYMWGGGLGMF